MTAHDTRSTVGTDRPVTPRTAGDPLADAVVEELDRLGTPARQALDRGLRHGMTGLDGLDEAPPDAVVALLEHLENGPCRVDPLTLHRGDVVSLSVPPLWFGLCSITSALAYTSASPDTARLLTLAGRPADTASRRLVETGVWARQTIRPGGLLRGGPGYLATVRMRLLLARMRTSALECGWDSAAWGLPISQADLARTWLGFTLVSFEALAAVGIAAGRAEERYLYGYWSYVAHLLGLDQSVHGEVADHAGARRVRDLLDSGTAAPDENVRALTSAMVDAQARAMAGAPGAVLSEEQVRALIHSVLRGAFGDEPGERLGIPAPAPTDLMPLIGKLNARRATGRTSPPPRPRRPAAGRSRAPHPSSSRPSSPAAAPPAGVARNPTAGLLRRPDAPAGRPRPPDPPDGPGDSIHVTAEAARST
ncbi:oxygenase MpaB family protein [Streptomyces cyaneochromogenes]|uniref:oxygenase MpaB family protein n=1 Tax=Streptomyces cyaneochromogenes TaxID=2496836 RepID=UPI001E3A559B|nr:oxygenase MpaB family protein [Streptomyces cyaneochromogenes]